MIEMRHLSHEIIFAADCTAITERWIQDRLSNDPSLLGLGPCKLLKREFPLCADGRVDLVLEDKNRFRRYIVEIQLGTFNDQHLSRLVDYHSVMADLDPGMELIAVAASECFSPRCVRFCRVIANTMRMQLVRLILVEVADGFTIVPVMLLDSDVFRSNTLGDSSLDSSGPSSLVVRTSTVITNLIHQIEAIMQTIDDRLTVNWTKAYVGVNINGNPSNCVIIRPRLESAILEFRIENNPNTTHLTICFGDGCLGYHAATGRYRVRIYQEPPDAILKAITDLLREAIAQCPVITTTPRR